MPRVDPHSYFDTDHARIETLDWKARVDFPAKTLDCQATLRFADAPRGVVDLDTRDLDVESVENERGEPLPFELGAPDKVLGARLRVQLTGPVRSLTVRYRTSAASSALQWLEPAQTAGGRQPFLFSQCQAVHARSIVPLQDTPSVRIKYRAELTLPRPLKALMAAGFVSREEEGSRAVETFELPQPIPPYLIALAVGDLASKELGPRSRVWAEPALLEKAAWEFAGVDGMVRAAEALFGPYDWDRFDILAMPPSFPYGGMENPRLTFITPTVIAGDRSLVSVIAHELAHSWTGNLVTNASAEHFWLNEGWTVFAERKILAALEGPELAALHAALGRRSLDRALEQFKERPQLTALRTHLAGVDPDEVFSVVPYEKGYLFLRALEDAVGEAAFARFVQQYVSGFRFQSLTTERFCAFVEEKLPGALAKVDAKAWLDAPGVPASAPAPRSARLDALLAQLGAVPTREQAAGWSPLEWQLYLESQRSPAPRQTLEQLEQQFELSSSGNHEILVAWLALAVASGFEPAVPKAEEVLRRVGRMKYLRPLYSALAGSPQTKARARALFSECAECYHPIARQVVEGILARAGA